MIEGVKNIFWDFDGVLLNSNSIRDEGFETVLKEYPLDEVANLMTFHRENGGLSRYVKFKYFFEEIRKEKINSNELQMWANKFSLIMKKKLVDTSLLIEENISFIKKNKNNYKMHITSGSDQNELIFLCKSMKIDGLFDSIHGSPKPKKEWIAEIIITNMYNKNECVLIGDSFNDYEAALFNGIHFIPYNNPSLKSHKP